MPLCTGILMMLFVAASCPLLLAQERKKWEEPQNLAILNSAFDDFAPAYSHYDRAVYFTSTRSGYAELYSSRYDIRRDAGTTEPRPRFTPAERCAPPFNQPRNNQSYISFAHDGTALLSTFRMTKRRPYLNIFQVRHHNTTLEQALPLDALNSDNFNAHATLSPSGKTVVFVSNRPGGRGGLDLWISSRDENGAWQPPVNMGSNLNSDADEITPYFTSEDTLFFSSNGFGGKGGFEIFFAVRSEGRWQVPIPVPELNSEYDDSDFALLPGNIGVFASNRTGSRGGLDLYVSRLLPVSHFVSTVEYKLATQTSFLTAEEFTITDIIQFPPCLVFEPNSSALPKDIKQYRAHETHTFSLHSLSPHPRSIYAEVLNILGKRLNDYPDATLTLTATESSNTTLSRERIDAIRNYLNQTWQIDSKRITIKISPVDAQTARQRLALFTSDDAIRCIELRSSDPRITAPIRIAGVHIITKPRSLNLTLDARPRSMIRSWSCTLTAEATGGEKDTILRTAGVTLPFSTTLPLEPSMWTVVPEEIQAHLIGLDSLNRKGSRTLNIPLYRLSLEQKRSQRVQDKIINRYRFLVPVSQNPSIVESTDQNTLIREIVSVVSGSAGTTLTLIPYGFGEKATLQAVERFAKNIADEIRRLIPLLPQNSVQIEPALDVLAPETPQERMLARSVVLLVEKPMPLSPQERRQR
ncbi:MAG: hypothetical protein NZ661_05030 [Candidatus Kapabacteria bacterium]|nr:hypothetical protein [Candidatus Kapabacteria bacterium]